MIFEAMRNEMSVCKLPRDGDAALVPGLCFLCRTGDEMSLVCETRNTPLVSIEREDGWRAFRVRGPLDFSMVGVLAHIAGVLAEREISVFCVSTYDTDYFMVRSDRFADAVSALRESGHTFIETALGEKGE